VKTGVVASAPGKLVILGEYLVLEGGPCLVAAVDRRARVEVRRASGERGRITTWMPAAEQHGFTSGQPTQLELVDQLRQALGLTDQVFDADLDTRACFDAGSGEKLGVGSSAALSCALWAALQTVFQDGAADLTYSGLDRLRVVLQGGGGSGVDLAASFAGGLQCFQRRSEEDVRLQPLDWPAEVGLIAVFSGHSAATADFVGQYRAWRLAAGAPGDALLERMSAVASAGCEAVATGHGSDLIGALDRYGTLMGELGEAMGKAVVTPTHAVLAEVARDLGGAYKPSGAGGGDIGIAGFTDSRALLAFKRQVNAQGLSAPELSIDPQGLTLEQQET
jgi:phosphomevalonate kinase